MFTRDWFFNLESQLIEMGADSDLHRFDVIKSRLQNPPNLSADDFARECIYVILAGGFSQQTAKKVYEKIISVLGTPADELLKIFNNKNKINAIVKIWENREKYRNEYYKNRDVNYLQTLPHIGKITANHLGRNLGVNIVKYDIWIRRLGAKFAGDDSFESCDKMFDKMVSETNLPRGYIDVVLWKACQQNLIDL